MVQAHKMLLNDGDPHQYWFSTERELDQFLLQASAVLFNIKIFQVQGNSIEFEDFEHCKVRGGEVILPPLKEQKA